jgi:general secretion pathway protein D
MRRLLAAGGLLLLTGCVTSGAFRAGESAESRKDYDRAVIEYSKALHEHPDNVDYKRSLERARLRASDRHADAGRLLEARGLYKEALDEFHLAQDLNPDSPELASAITETESRQQATVKPLTIDEMKRKTRERALEGLSLGPEAREPLGLSFHNASLREAYLALGKAVGVNFVFDPQFQDVPVTVDLQNVPFDEALTSLATVGHTFHRVTDAHVVTVVTDTPAKRREYEQEVVKTFFLSNADLKETIDLLRVVLGARRVAPLPGGNALTINDTPEKVAAAERIINSVDKNRAEVVVEVEILEINRDRLKDYGIEITSSLQGGTGIAGGAFPDPTGSPTIDQNPYRKSNILLSNLPGVIYRLLQTDATTRILANPQLRASDGQAAQARFGNQVPVPVTTFSPIASGGVSQQPITSFEYKNVGVNIDITPRVHHDGEVTLSLKVDISSQGPTGYQGLPTFNSRTVTSVIRLHDGETSILAGLIQDQERTSMTGIPGLASVPILGRLFARNTNETTATDIVMTLTPHVVRRPAITEEDLRSFEIGGEGSSVLIDAPIVPPFQAPQRPAPGGPEPPRVEPIRPPIQPSPAPPTSDR